MKIKISDMMDCIQDTSVSLRGTDAVSAEKIKELVAAGLRPAARERGGPRRVRRVLLIAAAAALALSLTATAVSRSLSMAEIQGPRSNYGPTVAEVGLSGSAEYQAAMEWDESLQKWYGSGENELSPCAEWDVYDEYGAHSRLARDTLDSLAEKYGLKLHSQGYTQVNSLEELYAAADTESFMPEMGGLGKFEGAGHYPGGKAYDDGTFSFNSYAALPEVSHVLYSFDCFAKGVFHRGPFLIIREQSRYEEWNYTTADGVEVMLAISPYQSLMAADLENCFVFALIRSGTDNDGSGSDSADFSRGEPTVSRADLEDLADSFDFAAINALCAPRA